MDARGEAEKSLEGRHRGTPPVEAEGELVHVGLEVVVTDAVVGAAEPGLEVAKDPVDVRQELRSPFGHALRAGAMPEAHARQRRVGAPAIRQDEGAGRDVALDESRQRGSRGIRHDLEAHPAGGLPPHFDRAHNQRLLQELAAPLQACLRTAQVGFVDLDLVLERFPLGVHHGPAQLVQECPRRLVADPELALQLDRRQPRGMGGHEVGGPEPHRQRQPRPMQDRARRQRRLPFAHLALPQPPVRQLEGVSLPASRTAKALWPPASGQVLPTRVVVSESDLELLQRLGEIGPAHLPTLPMGAFGVNPISS